MAVRLLTSTSAASRLDAVAQFLSKLRPIRDAWWSARLAAPRTISRATVRTVRRDVRRRAPRLHRVGGAACRGGRARYRCRDAWHLHRRGGRSDTSRLRRVGGQTAGVLRACRSLPRFSESPCRTLHELRLAGVRALALTDGRPSPDLGSLAGPGRATARVCSCRRSRGALRGRYPRVSGGRRRCDTLGRRAAWPAWTSRSTRMSRRVSAQGARWPMRPTRWPPSSKATIALWQPSTRDEDIAEDLDDPAPRESDL